MPVKILWIARTCPYPANDGEKLRVFNLLKNLAADHELTLVCRVMHDEEETGLAELRKFCAAVHGVFVPRPAGILEKLRWVAPFVFSRYPVSLSTVFFRQIARVLQELGDSKEFDIIQVEHSSLAIYLDHVSFPGKPRTLVTMHNIDFVRNGRIIRNTPPGITKCYHLFNQHRFKTWELRTLRRFDAIIAMSEYDRDILKQEVPGVPVHIVQNGVDTTAIPCAPADRPTPKVIFVASMDSEANHDGALYFINDIFPLLKKVHPAATVVFVGRNPRPELAALHNGADIVVTGKVADVFVYYRDAAVAIVPLRSGGGTRLKILEAMAAGTPVVSTGIGCEGLRVEDGEHLLVADTPHKFAESIGRLFTDDGFRRALIQRARAMVEADYDWRLIARQHDGIYRQMMVSHD
jgi:glycosyltransferase involved in cell wall biosynthesis